jgi:hydroxymethylbilane synthase
MSEFVIATRASDLALWQANAVADMLRSAHPGLDVRLETFSTVGDRRLDAPLSELGDKGLFTKELEVALLEGRADCAVHSLKDMQTQLPIGLKLGAVTRREAVEDALIAPAGTTIATLPKGGRVATGSLRRRAQLLMLRPDLVTVDVRGNVGTRLAKYDEQRWDGMILARAGLERLGFADRIAEVISPQEMIPAAGQGALGVEARSDDTATLELLSAIDDRDTRLATTAERAMLQRLEGGCQVPIGAWGKVTGERLLLYGVVASVDGSSSVRQQIMGEGIARPLDAEELGRELARRMIALGADTILEGVRNEAE